MTRSLAEKKASKGIQDKLRGKELKDTLIAEQIPFVVTGIALGEYENGPGWALTVDYNGALDNAVDVLILGCDPNRDDDMQLMAEDATLADPYGPFVLTRNGKRGYLRLEEVNGNGVTG